MCLPYFEASFVISKLKQLTSHLYISYYTLCPILLQMLDAHPASI